MKQELRVGKPVGIWIRVSTDMQVKADSPEHHERRARAYAESRDWDVVEVYRLEAVSGKSVREHPEAQRMLEDLRRGKIEALIFSKLARLARNTKELLDFADLFREQGADLVSLQESIDTSSPAGRLFYTLIAAMAQWEREEIGERVAASVQVRAQMGKPLGGPAVYGFRWKDAKLVHDPDEVPVRRLMFELFLSNGGRIRTVARELNERGYRSRKGNKWTGSSVTRLLKDPTAKGLRRANYTRSPSAGKASERKPEEEWIHTPVEPIVDIETFEKVNSILKARKTGPRPTKTPKYLFAGFIWCQCGARMNVPSDSPKYICRTCRNKIPIEDMEAVFSSQLTGYLVDPQAVGRSLEDAQGALDDKLQLLASLKREDTRIRSEMDRLMGLHRSGELPTAGFGRHYEPLEERLGQLDDEIPTLEGTLDGLRVQLDSQQEILSDAQDLGERFASLDFKGKRQVVENLVERIQVGKEEVDIKLFYLPFRAPFTLEPSYLVSQNVAKGRRDSVPAVGLASGVVVAVHARHVSATVHASPAPCGIGSTCRLGCSRWIPAS